MKSYEGYKYYIKVMNILQVSNYAESEVSLFFIDYKTELQTKDFTMNFLKYCVRYLNRANYENDNYMFIIYMTFVEALKTHIKKSEFYKDFTWWEKLKLYFI